MEQRTCSVDGCERRYAAKGYCGAHYQKWARTGDPTTPNRRPAVGPDRCALDGCDRPHYGKGMCEAHYARARRSGSASADPVRPLPRGRSEADRFWSMVDTSGDCWEWTGSRSRKGYGGFYSPLRGSGPNRRSMAHRWAWEELVGPIPDGLVIDHRCRNPRCVNPVHLEPVTQAVNIERAVRASA